jgi:hypothetical protein
MSLPMGRVLWCLYNSSVVDEWVQVKTIVLHVEGWCIPIEVH